MRRSFASTQTTIIIHHFIQFFMRYYLLLACTVVMLAIQACNSSSTPTAPPSYFAGLDKVGSYWIYENREIDSLGDIQSTSFIDSTWVDGIVTKGGRQATALVSCSYESADPSYDTAFVSVDGNRLYFYLSIPETPFTPATSPSWVLIAHADTSVGVSWKAIPPISFPVNQTIPLGGFDVKIESATNDVSVSIKADSNFTGANNVKYLSKRSVVTTSLSATGSAKVGPFPVPINISIDAGKVQQFFSAGVGLVGERTEGGRVVATGLGSSTPLFSQSLGSGSLRSLLRYKLK